MNLRTLLLATALAVALPAGAATSSQLVKQQFDGLSRLVKQTYPDGSWQQFDYDLVGNRIGRTDNLGRSTRYEYDIHRRLISATDALGGITRYSYDSRSNLVSVTDPRGLTTQYQYNGFDELLKQTSPDSGVSSFSYNVDGQPATKTDAKQQTVKYRYDAAGRVDRLTYADQSTTTFGYGATGPRTGKLQLITDSQGDQISIPYDDLGRPMGEWRTIAGKQYIVREAYDSTGMLKQRTYPSGRTVTYTFDVNGRIDHVMTQQVGGPTVSIAKEIKYRPFGPVKGWIYGNGEKHSRSFDDNGRLTQLSLGDGTLSLGYDAGGRIVRQQIAGAWWERLLQRMGLPIGQQQQYDYDQNDRVTGWQDGSQSQGYQYDANSNRTQLRVNDKTYPQRVDTTSNRLITSDGPRVAVYQYDANGSRLSDSKQSYTYNARGRLIAAAGAQYVVNALGQRIVKTYQGQTTLYHYDRQGHLVAETDDKGNTRREYIYLDDTPVAVIDFGEIRYIHTDHLGTARLITDASKHPIWAWQGDPFGNTAPNEDPEGTGGAYAFNLRFPGQYDDRESGLYYNYFRDYDPAIGGYPQSDPIGLAGGLNTYGYVGANPLSYTDPAGLQIEYANHEVALGLFHSKLIITPSNQARYKNDSRFQNLDQAGRRYATLGAGPNSYAQLESGANRPKDISQACAVRRPLGLPSRYSNEDDAIDRLFSLSNKYNENKERYTLLPLSIFNVPTGHNSNSFISGIGRAAGFNMPAPNETGRNTPGYQFPLPSSSFGVN
ncbi:RHS repeat protein [Chitinimonas arctica]|uniref:RHS repeat protein n=1 Tax=Chitinimonas arctica TaxID=2594795 RepID=A0A516SC04_9NEIS|nr:RHS repeat-associated core domain-containing protein [Chitinimonas arctica]QDQ25685.1 RHS repeat protein [Chitinimonas arctica]